MNPNPTTDKWTQEYVGDLYTQHGLRFIADAHNAAVKEAYEKGKQDGIREHEKELDVVEANWSAELAAEREHSAFCSKMANTRLEEIRQLKLDISEIRRQHQQEADEWTTDEELEQQLAAAQQPLVDALMTIGSNVMRQGDAIWMRDLAQATLVKMKEGK